MILRSFRLRLLLGALLAALGLVLVVHLGSILLIRQHRIVFHLGPASLMLIFALICLVAGLLQVRTGLSPFDQLRSRLSAVRDGRERLLEGSYPIEVQPLVNDLNALLEHREQIVRRAIAKAGDLAHGLKTPLAVLSQEAERAQAAGQEELSAAIRQQVERMRRQVDYHLAHARAAASGALPGARCSVKGSADRLARTLLRLHADRGLTLNMEISPEHAFRGQPEDLEEMLGNLLDNACQWAKSRVTIASSANDASIAITVDDDGPGLEASMHDAVLQRGVRADEAAPGSGLGLAIVRDLAELYGGSISLGESPSGGVRARLVLPAV
jgi:signal transduction histidine kinase